jgi:hypothetical protein
MRLVFKLNSAVEAVFDPSGIDGLLMIIVLYSPQSVAESVLVI